VPLVIVIVLVAALVSRGAAQERIERIFAVAPDVALRVHNLVGRVEIVGWDRDSIRVIAVIPPNGGRFFGGGGGRAAKLGIEGQDPSLAGPPSVVEVWVPSAARLWVKTATASARLVNVMGEVEVLTVTGPITVSGAPRVATLESIDGAVTLTGAATVVRARSGAGEVRIDGLRGDLTVTTVQGAVSVTGGELIAARIQTVSGPVSIAVAPPPSAQLEVESHDGPVTLRLTPPVDARFDLSSVKGSITTAVGGGRPRTWKAAARFAVGSQAGRGRGATITVRTFSGSIGVD
jgi:hypothetical protein